MASAVGWTADFGGYLDVCAYMRGQKPLTAAGRVILTALTAYMKHSALIAPAVPRSHWAAPPVELWRGVDPPTPRMPRVGSVVPSSDGGCFTALSLDWDGASEFANGPHAFVYRLQIDRIARGTPWVWFAEHELVRGLPPRWKDELGSEAFGEDEVLLPPGYFKVVRIFKGRYGTPVVDVAFVPRPEYVRRGAVPRLNSAGRAVVKTVGGHRLVTNNDAVVRNVRARRDRIARGAAAQLGRSGVRRV